MDGFTWKDGDRTIAFGRGRAADAPELAGPGYVLVTTPRAAAQAPELATGAAHVLHVGPGFVERLAAGPVSYTHLTLPTKA